MYVIKCTKAGLYTDGTDSVRSIPKGWYVGRDMGSPNREDGEINLFSYKGDADDHVQYCLPPNPKKKVSPLYTRNNPSKTPAEFVVQKVKLLLA